MPTFVKKPLAILIPILLIFGAAFFVYSQTFNAPFQYDDKDFVINNPDIRDLKNLDQLFIIHRSRVVSFLTFAVNYHFGQLRPFGYHVVNFGIHILVSLLVWLLARNLFYLHTKKPLTLKLQVAAALAAIMFTVHPVNTQAVSYITQRFASLSTLFYLSSVFFYIKARLAFKIPFLKWAFFVTTAFCILLGFYTKEVTITIPFMLLLVEFFLIKPYLETIHAQSKSPIMIHLKKRYIFGILSFSGLFLGFVYSGFLEVLFSPRTSESHVGDVFNLWTYILTQFRVMIHFMRLLVIPFSQNVSYDFPMSHSLFEWNTFLSAVVYFGIFACVVKLRKYSALISFGLLWFFLTLLVNFAPRNHVIFEHKVYLASIGPIIAFSYFLLIKFKSFKKYLFGMLIIIVTFSHLAFQRNKLWQNEIALWKDIVKKSPEKALAWANLGSLYTVRRDFDVAMEALNKALELQKDHLSAYNNRGFIYMERGDLDRALSDFNKAISINPGISVPHTNKAKIIKKRGDLKGALKILDKAISLNKNDYEAWNVRGSIYGQLGEYEKAYQDFRQANKANPHYSHPYSNMSLIRKYQNRIDDALGFINQALILEPNNGTFYFNRAMLYLIKNDLPKALKDSNIAIRLTPQLIKAYNQRGVIHAKLKKYDLAITDFKKAISLLGNYAEAHNNLGMTYGIINNNTAALAHLNKAIQLNPKYASAYKNRSQIYEKLGKAEEAAKDMKTYKTLTAKKK